MLFKVDISFKVDLLFESKFSLILFFFLGNCFTRNLTLLAYLVLELLRKCLGSLILTEQCGMFYPKCFEKMSGYLIFLVYRFWLKQMKDCAL